MIEFYYFSFIFSSLSLMTCSSLRWAALYFQSVPWDHHRTYGITVTRPTFLALKTQQSSLGTHPPRYCRYEMCVRMGIETLLILKTSVYTRLQPWCLSPPRTCSRKQLPSWGKASPTRHLASPSVCKFSIPRTLSPIRAHLLPPRWKGQQPLLPNGSVLFGLRLVGFLPMGMWASGFRV